jgi:MerR family transcriptional regulator, mercuric resistance operon regulatory protein
MRIGELAKAAGVHVQTIRFYERRGLLPPPSRSSAGYRDYRGDIVPLVQFIKQVQAHGYSLEEIRELLALAEHGTLVAETVRDRAKKKAQQIEAEIARLCGIRDWLMQFVSQSERGVVPPECLVLRRAATRAERTPTASSSAVASRTRSQSDPATRSERQSQRVAHLRADDHPSRLRRRRV